MTITIPPSRITSETEEDGQTVDEFKTMMYKMQRERRSIVDDIFHNKQIDSEKVNTIKDVLAFLMETTNNDVKEMILSKSEKNMKTFSINLKDEIVGLKKDINFLDEYAILNESNTNYDQINLAQLLTPFFTPSPELFMEEMNDCIKLLKEFIKLESADSDKPIFITDWDGTMKDYCSQYATNLQPIYSAIGMFKFASQFTRISAVLTAGPLKGPGILDLTAIPLDGPIVFSGSWGREWLINEKRVVHEDGISFEGFNALERLNDEIKELISENSDFSQFALVGSGIQRKVDRLTLGVQTVCKHVPEEISIKYQDAIKERMHRVDPEEKILIFDKSTELEVEVVVGTEDGGVWNKANGVERIVETMNDTLHGPGKVLICGDTSSDLPMVQKANDENEKGVMSIFVGANSILKQKVRNIVKDDNRVVFVTCPDVVHAAMWQILFDARTNEKSDL